VATFYPLVCRRHDHPHVRLEGTRVGGRIIDALWAYAPVVTSGDPCGADAKPGALRVFMRDSQSEDDGWRREFERRATAAAIGGGAWCSRPASLAATTIPCSSSTSSSEGAIATAAELTALAGARQSTPRPGTHLPSRAAPFRSARAGLAPSARLAAGDREVERFGEQLSQRLSLCLREWARKRNLAGAARRGLRRSLTRGCALSLGERLLQLEAPAHPLEKASLAKDDLDVALVYSKGLSGEFPRAVE